MGVSGELLNLSRIDEVVAFFLDGFNVALNPNGGLLENALTGICPR